MESCRFAVYRIYTSVIFHGSLLHVLFNMLALVPLGSELERVMGSIRLSYITILLATSNAILHLFIALLAANNPFYLVQYLMNECAIGFSGILFSMIVIETSLSGAQHRRFVNMLIHLLYRLDVDTILILICEYFILTIVFYFCSVFGLFNVPAQW